MPDGLIGYDPELIAQLATRVRLAVDDLAGIRSADPAAAAALGVVSVTQIHLESSWLPVLDRIAAGQSMAAPIEAMTVDEVLEFLRDDPLGTVIFGLIDVADERDLDEVDGNWSTHDVEAAADPEVARALVEDAVARGFDPGPGGVDAMVASVTAVASRLRDSDQAWEDIDDEVGWYEDVADAVVDVADDVWDRASTYGQYLYESGTRMAGNPLQTMWDISSGTVFLEQLAAAEAILLEDGELYTDDDGLCGAEAECITGARPLPSSAATTFGHSIVFEEDDPSDRLVRHEMQHVDDIETFGAALFYTTYGANFAMNLKEEADDVILGGQPLDEAREDAYHNIIWEQRADAAED
ncbi:MAG: hypothetical protein ABW219_17705 [Ilumatobacteraceae bacterium]